MKQNIEQAAKEYAINIIGYEPSIVGSAAYIQFEMLEEAFTGGAEWFATQQTEAPETGKEVSELRLAKIQGLIKGSIGGFETLRNNVDIDGLLKTLREVDSLLEPLTHPTPTKKEETK